MRCKCVPELLFFVVLVQHSVVGLPQEYAEKRATQETYSTAVDEEVPAESESYNGKEYEEREIPI